MNKQKLVDFSNILDMLEGDEKYIQEFAEAAMRSFQEFAEKYSKYLIARNETDFRKAGHKIKPVAQMLKIQVIIDEYEKEKKQFGNEKSTTELEESAKRMQIICSQVLSELKEIQQ